MGSDAFDDVTLIPYMLIDITRRKRERKGGVDHAGETREERQVRRGEVTNNQLTYH